MEHFLLWLGENALKGTLVTAIVFFVLLFFSHKIPAAYKYKLWYLSAVRFIMVPVFFLSFSFYALLPSFVPEELPVIENLKVEQQENTLIDSSALENMEQKISPLSSDIASKSWIAVTITMIEENISLILFGLWAIGAFGIIMLFVIRNIWAYSLMKGLTPLNNEKVNAHIAESCKLAGINRKFTLYETELTGSPVLIGFLKPKLLIPKNLLSKLKSQEFRYILLHEFMHMKKNDILINWVFGIICALQWFNPFAWYAFTRMKSDREEARDADVLGLLHKKELKEYGSLILKLSSLCWSGTNLAESVGIMEKNKKIKRRITMINKFQIMPLRSTLLAVAIIGAVGVSCLSEKKSNDTSNPKNEETVKLIKQLNKDPKVPEVNHKAAYIQEGRGWKGFRVGATRKELVAFMGKPDNPSETRYLKWKLKQNMHCLIDDARGAFELRFDRGCQQSLKNGIRIGTSMKEVEAQYGKPTSTENRGKAKKFIYSQKGILFWFYNNNVSQIVVFRPSIKRNKNVRIQAAYPLQSLKADDSLVRAKENQKTVLKPEKIIAKMAKAYATCKSYQDTGTVKTVFIQTTGERIIEKPFTTAFVRPGQFRFEYKEKVGSNEKPRYIVWRKGSEVLTLFLARSDVIEKKKSLSLGIAGATGVSGGSAHTIPALLLSEVGGRKLSDIKEAKMLKDGTFDNVKCFRIQGKFVISHDNSEFILKPSIIWIDKNSFLVRRIDNETMYVKYNVQTKVTTTYYPSLNGSIPNKMLEFDQSGGSMMDKIEGKALINRYLDQRKMENALEAANKLIEKLPELKKDKSFMRFRKKMIDNLSLKNRLGKFVFDKKTGLGEFVMQIDCYMNKYTLIKFYVPVDATGKALPEASDILMYIPWSAEALRTFTGGINKSYLKFAQREKMTVFTFTNWYQRGMYKKDRYFPYKAAGWYPYLFKMKKRIEQEFGLESRKLFISGQSSGGGMSQRLSIAYPDKIAAAAWNWGLNYTSDIPKKMPPILMMLNWSPYLGYRHSTKWMVDKSPKDANYLLRGYGSSRPISRGFDYHAASDETLDILGQFITDLRDLRTKNGGEIPAYKSWYKVINKSGEDKYYSSKEFYNKWKQLPLGAIKNMTHGNPSKLLIFPNMVDKPDRVVLYVGPVNCSRKIFSNFCLWDAMYYLAKSGAIAVSFNPKLVLKAKDVQANLDKIFTNKKWENLNLYIVGVGSIGETFINSLKGYHNKRLKGIKLINPVSRSVSAKSYKDIVFNIYVPGSSNEKGEKVLKYYDPKISALKAVELIAKK